MQGLRMENPGGWSSWLPAVERANLITFLMPAKGGPLIPGQKKFCCHIIIHKSVVPIVIARQF